jgi:FkbM family methyltransferase
MSSSVRYSAYFDLKLNIFRALKEIPIQSVRTRYLRSYYGRLRRHTAVDLAEVVGNLPKNPVIVDLGANERLFIPDEIVSEAAEIHAVEPDPNVFKLLQKNVQGRSNVILYNAAVGASDGTVSLYRESLFDPNDPTKYSLGASIFPQHQAVDASAPTSVPQIGILSFLEKIGKRIDLMKVDIEGAEVPVLETLLSSPLAQNITIMLVETHEFILPGLADRTHALRKRAKNLSLPHIDMNWH